MDPPDGSSTVVSFIRVRKPIWFAHVNWNVCVPSGSLTSVARWSEIRPSDRTTGVKLSVTP